MDTPLPETQLINEEEEELEELLPELYVEKATSLMWEVKFFDTFVLIRPATPAFYLAIKKMSHPDFLRDFVEFCGDPDKARDFIRSATPDFILD